jgi:glyoxylase-like metal-dependent hydrolase (beta-lactamase superfamily II)
MTLDPARVSLASSPFGDDLTTTLAAEVLTVGDRSLLALSDGFFNLEKFPDFLGTPHRPHALYDDQLAAGVVPPRLPVGAFLWPGEPNVLIDAGYGPRAGGGGALVGGQLPQQMRQFGFNFDDIGVLAISHLHGDHAGWLADASGRPMFPNAQVHLGAKDWHYFVESDDSRMEQHLRHALVSLAEAGRVTLMDLDDPIAPGVRRLSAPGHTPGHSVYLVEDAHDRAIIFGDAIYCPQQLTDVDWAATSDVDPVLARSTREHLLRELDQNGGLGIGCHFPGLRGGRVLSGMWQPA